MSFTLRVAVSHCRTTVSVLQLRNQIGYSCLSKMLPTWSIPTWATDCDTPASFPRHLTISIISDLPLVLVESCNKQSDG